MKCLDRTELERFLDGRLGAERLLAVDEHLAKCAECRAVLDGVSAFARAGAGLGQMLLDVADCPEYEDLSAYVDGGLDAKESAGMRAHLCSCELCFRDVTRIEQLRAQASMRDTVAVTPGGTLRRSRPEGSIFWKRVFAVAPLAAAVAVVAAIGFGYFGQRPDTHTGNQIAQNPPISAPVDRPDAELAPPTGSDVATPPTVDAPSSAVATVPEAPRVNRPAASKQDARPAAPAYRTALKDGKFRVIEQDGKFRVLGEDGKPVRGLSTQVAAAMERKLNKGRIERSESMVVAWNTLTRGDEYIAPPTAPKQIGPNEKFILSPHPTLDWEPVDMADAYRVIVADQDGNRVTDAITTGTSLKIPEPLERGRIYQWRVGVRFAEGDPWANSGAMKFKVVSREGYQAIQQAQQQMPGSHLALGAAYEASGLYEDAAREYNALRSANPESPLAGKLLLK